MAERILANIVRVDMITEEETPKLISGSTSTEATLEPYISEGAEEVLRSKNRILAQNNFEDLILGYNVTLKEVNFDPETFALFDGGVYTATGEDYTYDGPMMGEVVRRTRLTLDLWTEEKDVDGETICFHRFRLLHARGTPIKFAHKDGAFYAPEYPLKSRAKKGERPIAIKSFEELPDEGATPDTLLAL